MKGEIIILDRDDYFFTARYTRGQVCKVLGVTRDTLRHYENCGIITPQENEVNKYKYYSIADLEVLNVILFLRAMDISIKDVPRFIQCNDINTYGDFLEEQINKANEKINYWKHIRNTLSYLKKTLEDYKKFPENISIIENTIFRFRASKFDYNNYDIEKMAPYRISDVPIYHVIKLKVVDENWILSNRKDTSELLIGHLCDEDELEKDISVKTIPLALTFTTLKNLEELPKVIMDIWKNYDGKYKFDYKAYIIEHTFFNIFNEESLLRNIYLPISKIKEH